VLRIRDLIPDPKLFHPGSRIAIKEFKYFNPKNCFKALGNMIQFVHPGSGSRIRILIFLPIPDTGVKKAPDPGSGSATLDYLLLKDILYGRGGILGRMTNTEYIRKNRREKVHSAAKNLYPRKQCLYPVDVSLPDVS
jgi:hypothetical protein